MPAKAPPPWALLDAIDVDEVTAEARRAITRSVGVEPLTQYQRDPIGFGVDVLGIARETMVWSMLPEYATHQWDGTVDPLERAALAIADGTWPAVSSGTGTGKTFLMAFLLLWYLGCFRDSVVTTVATKEKQMEKGAWREVSKMWPAFSRAFPTAQISSLRIRMEPSRGDTWAAWAITAQVGADESSATGVQGLHNPHLLVLCDEMPGIPMPIITALINTAKGGNVIAGFGNPDHQQDPLATFGRMKRVLPIRISALDHPNVVTDRVWVDGAADRPSVEMLADEFGIGSTMYDSRVRGIAPAQAVDALIHRAWVVAAVERGTAWTAENAMLKHPVAYGADPSNSDGGDMAAVARFQGPLCTWIRAKRCPDANVFGRELFILAEAERVEPAHIGVDSIGVGAGTVNESRRLYNNGYAFKALNGGAQPIKRIAKGGEGEGWQSDVNNFLNLRAQMYWQAREDLRHGMVGLPNDPELIEELIAPTYEIRAGKVVIEKKDDIKTRLGRSPNKADAFVYGNWVRPRTLPVLPPKGHPDTHHLGFRRGQGADPALRVTTSKDVLHDLHPIGKKPENFWSGW